MISQELTDYISSQRAQGVSDEAIREALLKAGWDVGQVEQGLLSSGGVVPRTSLPSTIALLKEAWGDYRKHFKLYFSIQLIASSAGLTQSLFAFLTDKIASPVIRTGSFWTIINGSFIYLGISFILILLNIILGYVGWIALIYSIDASQKPRMLVAFNKGLKLFKPLVLTSILATLITWGGYLLFLIPGILMSFWFYFSIYVVVVEKKSGLSALFISKRYMYRNILQVIWRHLVLTVLSIPIFILLLVPFILLTKNSELITLVISLEAIVIGPFYIIFNYLLYKYLRQMHTGGEVVVTKKQKITYGLFALLGPLAIAVIIGLIVFVGRIDKGSDRSSQDSSNSLIDPQGMLAKSHDTTRKAELHKILTSINVYYEDERKMPLRLEDLVPVYIVSIPKDPKTEAAYEYTNFGNGKFELCAQFETPTPSRKCITEVGGDVKGLATVRKSAVSFVEFLPVPFDLKLFISLIERSFK